MRNVLGRAVRTIRTIVGIKPGGLPSDLIDFDDWSDDGNDE